MIKNLLIISALFISLNAFSQFPAPKNFEFKYVYIHLDEMGYCVDKPVLGPAYCSEFHWSAPDTTTTTAKLSFYKINYDEKFSTNTSVLTTTTDTSYVVNLGIMGQVWVTAVYSNPDGESSASNVVINDDLPIHVKDLNALSNKSILFNREQQTITVENVNNLKEIRVIDSAGKIVKTDKSKNTIDISGLPSGLYIIEVTGLDSNLIRQKIIK